MKDEASILTSACRVILRHLGSEWEGREVAELLEFRLDRTASPDLLVDLEVDVVMFSRDECISLGLHCLLEDGFADLRELCVGKNFTAHPGIAKNVSHSRST